MSKLPIFIAYSGKWFTPSGVSPKSELQSSNPIWFSSSLLNTMENESHLFPYKSFTSQTTFPLSRYIHSQLSHFYHGTPPRFIRVMPLSLLIKVNRNHRWQVINYKPCEWHSSSYTILIFPLLENGLAVGSSEGLPCWTTNMHIVEGDACK